MAPPAALAGLSRPFAVAIAIALVLVVPDPTTDADGGKIYKQQGFQDFFHSGVLCGYCGNVVYEGCLLGLSLPKTGQQFCELVDGDDPPRV
jgi:hypothetical protein